MHLKCIFAGQRPLWPGAISNAHWSRSSAGRRTGQRSRSRPQHRKPLAGGPGGHLPGNHPAALLRQRGQVDGQVAQGLFFGSGHPLPPDGPQGPGTRRYRAHGRGHLRNCGITEIVKTISHRGQEPQVYFWRTAARAEVEIVVAEGAQLISLETKLSATPRPDMARSLTSFQ